MKTVAIAVAYAIFAAATAAAADQASQSTDALDEVLVTAQKRSERLQDVPVPITALSTDSMVQQGKGQLEDYFASVPGLTVNAQGAGQRVIVVRGLATASLANPTVAASIDDVPFGSSTFLGRGSTSYPNIDPSDLARIEVLRGPQGTLYGASSIGGVLKFVTVDPSTDRLSGNAQLSSSVIDHGGSGYGASGSVNIPVSDRLAVRGSAFTRRDPGYVTKITTGQHRIDEADSRGGRLSALWHISDAVSLKVSGLYQKDEADGSARVESGLGGFRQAGLPGTGNYDSDVQFYTAVLTADLGSVDLTSVTGYTKSTAHDITDFSGLIAFYYNTDVADGGYGLFGATAGAAPVAAVTKRFTQELRLSSKLGQRVDWLAGLFFNDERSPSVYTEISNDPVTGAELLRLTDYYTMATVREYSAFANLTWHVTDRFDVQVGGREARIEQGSEAITTSVSTLPALNSVVLTETDANAFTYLLTPRFKFSPNLMAYARFASGYRLGSTNIVQPNNPEVPDHFEPDKTYSYELGAKGTSPGGMFSFDASVFYIDWRNVQIELANTANTIFYRDNAGGARSKGLEISAQARPIRGMTMDLALGFTDAELTADLPPNGAVGVSGDRLPFSARFTGSLSINQEFPLGGDLTGSVGGTVSQVGKRVGQFPSPGGSQLVLPSYTSLDLRAGAHNEAWSVDLYLNNLSDKRGLIGRGASANVPGETDDIYIQPRTLGLSLTRTF